MPRPARNHSSAGYSDAARSGSTRSDSARSHGAGAPRRGRPSDARPGTRTNAPKSGAAGSGGSSALQLNWNEIDQDAVDPATLPSFTELGLPSWLADALAKRGVTRPFPIQAAVIADVLAGRDVLGRAATGAGKTLAFGLPTLASLGRTAGVRAQARHPRGLVLVPTRELAMQVTDALTGLAQVRGLNVRLVAGGLPIGKQIDALRNGVDLLVCTPGRLEDLIARNSCDLSAVEITVLDEADHMSDLGFLPAVKRILSQTPADGQRLLFSATLDGAVGTLVTLFLTNPAAHAVASATAQVDTMTHRVLHVGADDKLDVTAAIGAREGRTIMFVRTKHGADRLAKQLGRVGVAAGALHGGRSQSQRTKALDAFKDGSVPVLVATDVAARGIHVDEVSLVLHVDPPAESKDYLHRSGRTARAGASGTVVVLATPDQQRPIRKLLHEADVTATQHAVRADDEALTQLTGARRPSGVPVVVRAEPTARPGVRGSRLGRAEGGRGGSEGGYARGGARGSRPERTERSSRPDRPVHSTTSARPHSAAGASAGFRARRGTR